MLQESNNQINLLHSRLDASEQRETQMLQRQNQMIQFLSKALQHPEVLSQLVGARQRISANGEPAAGAAPPHCSWRVSAAGVASSQCGFSDSLLPCAGIL